jgi:hypothetical protein
MKFAPDKLGAMEENSGAMTMRKKQSKNQMEFGPLMSKMSVRDDVEWDTTILSPAIMNSKQRQVMSRASLGASIIHSSTTFDLNRKLSLPHIADSQRSLAQVGKIALESRYNSRYKQKYNLPALASREENENIRSSKTGLSINVKKSLNSAKTLL